MRVRPNQTGFTFFLFLIPVLNTYPPHSPITDLPILAKYNLPVEIRELCSVNQKHKL